VKDLINLECLTVSLPEDIARLVAFGDFEHAVRVIDIKLESNIPQALRERLEFEKIRMDWARREYIYSFEEALSRAQAKIRDFNLDELKRLKDEGYAEWAYVNGVVMFHSAFLGNIIKTYPGIKARLFEPEEDTDLLDTTIDEITEKGKMAYYIHIKAGLKLKKEGLRTSELIKVHIPVPTKCQQVKNINILKTAPEAKFASPEDYPQRTVYFEEKILGEDEFTVEYSYENHVEYKSLDYDKVVEGKYSFDTEELLPHIAFTPYLKSLADEIVKDEKNPLRIARKIYDFITTKIKYSYVREYSTIEHITEYAALNLKGDCGLQALLFITLCRLSGVPAKWQSGLYVTPDYIGPHDWAQFYVEPYGWLFADPSFGGSAYKKGIMKRWNFYFGNIDPFRMPANSEFQHEFIPKKKYLRSDPYDNQRGEVEYEDMGVYYNGFQRIMEVLEIHKIL
jgi:transglutaminase-like putative cysteine protease